MINYSSELKRKIPLADFRTLLEYHSLVSDARDLELYKTAHNWLLTECQEVYARPRHWVLVRGVKAVLSDDLIPEPHKR